MPVKFGVEDTFTLNFFDKETGKNLNELKEICEKIYDLKGNHVFNYYYDPTYDPTYEIIFPQRYDTNVEKFNKEYFCKWSEKDYMKIKDINVIVPNKVVEVIFIDGTKEKSVCQEPDVFSMETAIAICISKKIMGGSGAYNNAIKQGVKVYEEKLRKEAEEKAEQKRIEKRREKRLAYKKRRNAKKAELEQARKNAEKEEQIEIQKEAYLRAMIAMKEYESVASCE